MTYNNEIKKPHSNSKYSSNNEVTSVKFNTLEKNTKNEKLTSQQKTYKSSNTLTLTRPKALSVYDAKSLLNMNNEKTNNKHLIVYQSNNGNVDKKNYIRK